MSIINSMKTGEGQSNSYRLQFPQHHKSDKKKYGYSNQSEKRLSLTTDDIEKIINDAFRSAKEYAALVNMGGALVKRNLHSLSDLSQFVQTNLKRSSAMIVDYTESDSWFEVDGSQEPNDQDQISSDVTSNTSEHKEDDGEDDFGDTADVYGSDHDGEHDEDDQADERGDLAKDLSKVQEQTFQGCRIYDKVSATKAFKFFRIRVGNSIKYVHKQTASWLLTDACAPIWKMILNRLKENFLFSLC